MNWLLELDACVNRDKVKVLPITCLRATIIAQPDTIIGTTTSTLFKVQKRKKHKNKLWEL